MNKEICGLNSGTYQKVSASGKIRPRVRILIKTKFSYFLLSQYSNTGTVSIELSLGEKRLVILSSYFTHDNTLPPTRLSEAVKEANHKKVQLLFEADADSQHTAWSSNDINIWGEPLLDFNLENDLEICNCGNKATFVTSTRKEVLDITLARTHFLTRSESNM